MKRIVFASLLAVLFLAGCVTAGPAVVAEIPVPTPIVVAHVHGPYCGHFWGVWEGRPIYYDHGLYSYWNGAGWVALARPPVVYRTRVHHPDSRYHYYSRGAVPRGYAQPHAVRPPPQARPHHAVPAR